MLQNQFSSNTTIISPLLTSQQVFDSSVFSSGFLNGIFKTPKVSFYTSLPSIPNKFGSFDSFGSNGVSTKKKKASP